MTTAPGVASSQEAKHIRALLISHVRLYREGLESALGRRDTIAVVGAASTIAEGMDAAVAHDPTVIIIDIAMRDSLSGVRALAAAAPQAKIVVFAANEQACDIPAYAEAGMAGYVPTEASVDDLVAVIESVIRQEAFCSPRVAGALFRRVAALAGEVRPPERFGMLSRREREVVTLIRNGLSNKEIAQKLSIEVATVKNHVHSLLTKLHVGTRAQAANIGRPATIRSSATSI